MKSVLMTSTIWLLFAGCNQVEESFPPTASPVAGLWKLHIIEALDSSSGKWVEAEWMKGGDGYILYDPADNMSIFFTPKDYATSQARYMANVDSLSLNDMKWLSQNYWYAAKYKLDEKTQIVTHQRIIHVHPDEWGQVVQRKYEIREDTLILTPVERNLRLKWIRQ